MRLLQVTGTLDPVYGGPPVVVGQISRGLAKLGHAVHIITLDQSSDPWLTSESQHTVALGGVGRYRFSPKLLPWLALNVKSYDAVIVHGIWQYQSLATRRACKRAGVPYFLFVHGALDPWFRDQFPGKHMKKSLYWRLFENRTIRDARAVLYTAEDERSLARTSFEPYDAAEALVPIGIDEPPGNSEVQRAAFFAVHPELEGKRILLFLGRLHEKKGCELLVRAFAQVAGSDEALRLVMAGPSEGVMEASLKQLSRQLGIEQRVTWTGMLLGDSKWGAFRAADAFALTSHSENFGIAVAEALACSCPVLLSEKVNIWREIAACNAGLIESDTIDGAVRLLRRWLELSDLELSDMRTNARQCFTDNFEAHGAAVRLAGKIASALR